MIIRYQNTRADIREALALASREVSLIQQGRATGFPISLPASPHESSSGQTPLVALDMNPASRE